MLTAPLGSRVAQGAGAGESTRLRKRKNSIPYYLLVVRVCKISNFKKKKIACINLVN